MDFLSVKSGRCLSFLRVFFFLGVRTSDEILLYAKLAGSNYSLADVYFIVFTEHCTVISKPKLECILCILNYPTIAG
jgi:hypothetical protein